MDATSNSAGRRRKRSRSPSPLLPQPPPSLRPASSRPERYRDHHYRGERGGSSPSSLPYHGGCRESLPRRSPSPCFAPPPPSPLLPVSSRQERCLVHDGCGRGSPTYSPYRGGRGQSLPRNSPSMPLKRSRLGDEYGCRGNSSGERFVDPKQDYGFLTPPGPGGSHDYMGRGPRSGRCLNCGIEGHWARDCNAGDWKNKGYFSGERDHVDRNCQNSPKNLKRGRSNSRLSSPCCERSQSRSYSRCRRRYSDPNATGEKPLTQQSSEDTRRMNSGNVDKVRPVRRYKRSYRRYTWQNRTAHRIPVLSGRRQEPRGDCSYFSTVAAMESQLRLVYAFPEELSISYIKKKDEKMKLLNCYKRMGRNQRLLKILKETGIPKRLDYRAYCQGQIVECHMYKIAGHVEYHLSRRGDIRRALTNHLRRGPMIAVFAISTNYNSSMRHGSIYKFIEELHMDDKNDKTPVFHSVCVVGFGVEESVPFLAFRTEELNWPEFGRVELKSVRELYGINVQ